MLCAVEVFVTILKGELDKGFLVADLDVSRVCGDAVTAHTPHLMIAGLYETPGIGEDVGAKLIFKSLFFVQFGLDLFFVGSFQIGDPFLVSGTLFVDGGFDSGKTQKEIVCF